MNQTETTNIYSITTQDVLNALSRRIDPATLSPEDLQLAIQEVKDALQHHLELARDKAEGVIKVIRLW